MNMTRPPVCKNTGGLGGDESGVFRPNIILLAHVGPDVQDFLGPGPNQPEELAHRLAVDGPNCPVAAFQATMHAALTVAASSPHLITSFTIAAPLVARAVTSIITQK